MIKLKCDNCNKEYNFGYNDLRIYLPKGWKIFKRNLGKINYYHLCNECNSSLTITHLDYPVPIDQFEEVVI